ncbi:hypothetical protein [Lysobacter hankyongensis]|uniref:hypothetical protein n=1 Tax=Lysobacter hankyongensis TaxID=1176535 RepID=UPI0031EBA608
MTSTIRICTALLLALALAGCEQVAHRQKAGALEIFGALVARDPAGRTGRGGIPDHPQYRRCRRQAGRHP